MQLAEIIIKPESAFRTPLKGDTLFGHFCWQVAYNKNLFHNGIEGLTDNYKNQPGIIFSSPCPVIMASDNKKYFFPKPALPGKILFKPNPLLSKDAQFTQGIKDRKKNKKKKWLQVNSDLIPNLNEKYFKTDKDILKLIKTDKNAEEISTLVKSNHNKINRNTNTTTGLEFAPFSEESIFFQKNLKFVLFALFDSNKTTLNSIITALNNIGTFGYGKDASTGMGKFKVIQHNKLKIPNYTNCNALMTTGPALPQKELFENNIIDKKYYFNPFVRFGKHGDIGAISGNPWKNPVILADEGAVFKIKQVLNNPFLEKLNKQGYIGRGLKNPSKATADYGKNCIHQAYSFCLPLTLSETE